MCLGNHEFDLKAEILATFADHCNFPIVASNLDFSHEPQLQGKFKKSTILNVAGRKIGIIGYLTPATTLISSTGDVEFENEVVALKREAKILNMQGINIIIALGHSGYQVDQTIAKEVALVDVVIGGHTNTFLYNGPQPDAEEIVDSYPNIVTQPSGKRVPVVQAFAYTKYLGVLNCTFNSKGDLIKFAGQPILMDTSIPQAQDLLDLLDIYRPGVEELDKEVLGDTRVFLDGRARHCRNFECNLGNLITDAYVHYAISESTEFWTNASICIFNSGGIRNSINIGSITKKNLWDVLPFDNQIILLTLKGSDLIAALEQMVRSNGDTSKGEFPQVSGLRLVLDLKQPVNSRVISAKARCGLCDVPSYSTINPEQNYSLLTTDFLVRGGDGVTVFKQKALTKRDLPLEEITVIVDYVVKFKPIYTEVQERITFVNSTNSSTPPTDGVSAGGKLHLDRWILLLIVLYFVFVIGN